jgi:predicted transcriptional regulator
MERKRSRTDIVHDILEAILLKGGKIKPTHLMYKANLSHIQMNSYLDELMKKNLVEKIKEKNANVITLTESGYEFRNKIKEIIEFERTFGL